jgi:aspartate aminotransferase
LSLIRILDHISFGKIVQIREELLKQQAAGKKVIRFESGDPNFDLAPHVLEALQRAAATGKTHYIPNAGIPDLRKALFQKVTQKNGIPIRSAEDIFVTNGAMHALYIVFASLLQEGDECIVPDPMWTEVVENIKLSGATPVRVPLLREQGYLYSAEEIAKHITPRTKAIFLNSPQNPTGAVLNREQLQAIQTLAKERNLWIVSDEAYEDVIFAPNTHISIGSLDPSYIDRTISIFSFSKSYAMSGLRVGYIATTNQELQDRLQKLLRCTINGVNSTGQWAALAAITGPQDQIPMMQAEYIKRRDILFNALAQVEGIKPFQPKGSFFIWADCDQKLYDRLGVKDADAVSHLLAEQGVGSAPGSAFSDRFTDSLRFAFSCATPMVVEGSTILQEILSRSAVGV